MPKSWSPEVPYADLGGCNASDGTPGIVNFNYTNACKDNEAIIVGDEEHWCAYNESKLKYPLWDEIIANQSIHRLKLAAQHPERPFFLGVGFHRPHLPFAFPKEFMDQYYPNVSAIAPAKHPNVPIGLPSVAWHEGNFDNTYEAPCPAEKQQIFRRAYYSAVSYTDSLIGRVLNTLEQLGMMNNTVVSFHGDRKTSLPSWVCAIFCFIAASVRELTLYLLGLYFNLHSFMLGPLLT